jgi:CRP-like cAMP-binding protein
VNTFDRRLLHGAVLKDEDEEENGTDESGQGGYFNKPFARSTPSSREALLRNKTSIKSRGRIVFDLNLRGIGEDLWNAITFQAPLKPFGRIRTTWDTTILSFICYGLFMIPFDLAFFVNPIPWLLLDVVMDMFFVADLGMNFLTAYTNEDNQLVTDFAKIRRHYITTWFFFDLIASIPFGIISLTADDGSETMNFIKLLKVFRLFRMSHLYRAIALLSAMKGPVLVLLLMVGFGVSAHWIACLFWKIGTLEPEGANWIHAQKAIPDLIHREQVEQYVACLYWAMATLTTTGYGDFTPVTHAEFVYVTIVVLIGAAMYAILISSVSMIVMSQFSTEAEYTRHMDEVHAFGALYHLPPTVTRRVVAYYDFLWERKKSFSNKSLMTDLPLELKAVVAGAVHAKMIDHNPLLASCDSFGFNHMFAAKLGNIVLRLPDEVLHFEGDPVAEIYFVRRGLVDVVVGLDTPDELVVGKRSDGGHCGDIGLFVGSRRHATSTVTLQFSEVCTMDAQVLLDLLKQYPKEREMFERVAKARSEAIDSILTEFDELAAQKESSLLAQGPDGGTSEGFLGGSVSAVGENAGRFLLQMFGQTTTDNDVDFFWKMWEQHVAPATDEMLVEDTIRAYSIEVGEDSGQQEESEAPTETQTLKQTASFHLGSSRRTSEMSDSLFTQQQLRRRSSIHARGRSIDSTSVEDALRTSPNLNTFLNTSLEEPAPSKKASRGDQGLLGGFLDVKQQTLDEPVPPKHNPQPVNEDGGCSTFDTLFLGTLIEIDSRIARLERVNHPAEVPAKRDDREEPS